MPLTASGDLGTLTLISAEYDSNSGKIHVRFSLDTTSATETLTGFKFWHDDETGNTMPVWVDASSTTEVQGDSDTPTIYEVLVPVPLDSAGVVTWWETFEEYAIGAAGTLDKGGSIWDGPTVVSDSWTWVDASEDFESYATGPMTGDLNGGDGWDDPAVIGDII